MTQWFSKDIFIFLKLFLISQFHKPVVGFSRISPVPSHSLSLSIWGKLHFMSTKNHYRCTQKYLSKTDMPVSKILPEWCPKQQIYINGIVPHNSNEAEEYISSILNSSSSSSDNTSSAKNSLKIFGYGSLCWNPGNPEKDTLAKANEGVTTTLGYAIGWKRCWSQKSADHRGNVYFNGLVCTLLKDDEVESISIEQLNPSGMQDDQPSRDVSSPTTMKNGVVSMTHGVIYTIPLHLTKACLAELDFREKGGYSRDVIDVIEDETGNIIKALLYRGTPDNPAFSRRALLDLGFAAATMAVACGPSGRNDQYLYSLDTFLTDSMKESSSLSRKINTSTIRNSDHTQILASISRHLQKHNDIFFLFGCGSNQHNQLLLNDAILQSNAASLVNRDEAHILTDIILVVPKEEGTIDRSDGNHNRVSLKPKPKCLYAGGGHSGLLTECGNLYLWGSNDEGQLGRSPNMSSSSKGHDDLIVSSPLVDHYPTIIHPLPEIKVKMAAFGHDHTLVIEKTTQCLYSFGNDSRGQVSGIVIEPCSNNGQMRGYVQKPLCPKELMNDKFVSISAGLFHSAAITDGGSLVTFGCSRFCQSLKNALPDSSSSSSKLENDIQFERKISCISRWHPEDGSRLIKVACGRRHTVMLDEYGRIWTMGDNKYGQLGRKVDHLTKGGNKKDMDQVPRLVEGYLGEKNSGCVDIQCGWSHTIAIVKKTDSTNSNHETSTVIWGWGRNDKNQLGLDVVGNQTKNPLSQNIQYPTPVINNIQNNTIQTVCCGAESIMAVTIANDGSKILFGSGWNEHGNLGSGEPGESSKGWKEVIGSNICKPPPYDDDLFGVGDVHNNHSLLVAAGGAHFLVMVK